MSKFFDLVKTRRSVRTFDGSKLDRVVIALYLSGNLNHNRRRKLR